jgi:hypothetical protein
LAVMTSLAIDSLAATNVATLIVETINDVGIQADAVPRVTYCFFGLRL